MGKAPFVPLYDGSGFLLPCQEAPIPLKNPAKLDEHILCQIFGTYKLLFFISFFKTEYNKWPNFAV
jgi:hypothetical protein